jgi:hypothetical protein
MYGWEMCMVSSYTNQCYCPHQLQTSFPHISLEWWLCLSETWATFCMAQWLSLHRQPKSDLSGNLVYIWSIHPLSSNLSTNLIGNLNGNLVVT